MATPWCQPCDVRRLMFSPWKRFPSEDVVLEIAHEWRGLSHISEGLAACCDCCVSLGCIVDVRLWK